MTVMELLLVAEADAYVGLASRLMQEATGRPHGVLALQRARALLELLRDRARTRGARR